MRIKILILLLCLCRIASAQKNDTKLVEKLIYKGYYSLIFNIQAGIIELTSTPSDRYPKARLLYGTGASTRDWLFKIRDTLFSYHDSITLLPYEFSRKAHEGNYHKTFDYTWDYENDKIYSYIHKIDRYKRRDTIALKPTTYDMLSMVWYIRKLDYHNYSKGDIIPIRVLIDDKIDDLYARYLGKGEVKVASGKRMCHIFAFLLVEGDVFKGGEDMRVWISDDEYRVPLMLEAKIIVGAIRAILDEESSIYKKIIK